jgi:hypothetical protein
MLKLEKTILNKYHIQKKDKHYELLNINFFIVVVVFLVVQLVHS